MGDSAWLEGDDWELIYEDPPIGETIHRAWVGHGWLVDASRTDGARGLAFVPPAPRGPWASPESAVDRLGDVAAP